MIIGMKKHSKHLFLFAFLLVSRISLAQDVDPAEQSAPESSPTSRAVLLLTSADTKEEMGELKSALGAYLSDLEAVVELRAIDSIPSDLQGQIKLARKTALSESEILSVIWLETSGDEFFVFISDSASERVLIQTMPSNSEGWEAECDAIATLVRSALSPWLADHSMTKEESPSLPPMPGETPASLPHTGTEKPPEPIEPAAPIAPPEKNPVQLVVLAAYAPISSSNFDGPLTHGAELGIGMLFNKYIEVDISINVGHIAKIDISNADIHLVRWPINLSLLGILPVNRFEFGLRLGLVVDPTTVQGIVKSEAPDNTDMVHVGFAPSLFARFHMIPLLAIWVGGGAYFFAGEIHYAWNSEKVFTYGEIQPQFSTGLALTVPLIR
jgi:hypothetical protein